MEEVTSAQLLRRWTLEQKLEIVKKTNESVSSVSLLARQNGLTEAQLYQWRKTYLEGSMVNGVNESVDPLEKPKDLTQSLFKTWDVMK